MIHLLIWLIVLQIVGAAGFVWAFHLFRDLPDRGYGVSKVLGLLLTAYALWALVTARVLENGLLSLLIVLALLLGASAILFREHRGGDAGVCASSMATARGARGSFLSCDRGVHCLSRLRA